MFCCDLSSVYLLIFAVSRTVITATRSAPDPTWELTALPDSLAGLGGERKKGRGRKNPQTKSLATVVINSQAYKTKEKTQNVD